jgi:hypothetical protein
MAKPELVHWRDRVAWRPWLSVAGGAKQQPSGAHVPGPDAELREPDPHRAARSTTATRTCIIRTVQLRKTIRFEAAHRLPLLPATQECARLHGHGFVAEIALEGELDPRFGWVIDFAELAETCELRCEYRGPRL